MMDPRTSLQHIYKLLMACPDLTSRLSMDNAIRFVRLASSVKLAIIHAQKPSYNTVRPPDTLPTGIKEFLSGALGMECGDIAACWTAFQDSIWAYRPEAHTAAADARLFHDHRANNQLSMAVSIIINSFLSTESACSVSRTVPTSNYLY
jgi:hypothetical protein